MLSEVGNVAFPASDIRAEVGKLNSFFSMRASSQRPPVLQDGQLAFPAMRPRLSASCSRMVDTAPVPSQPDNAPAQAPARELSFSGEYFAR